MKHARIRAFCVKMCPLLLWSQEMRHCRGEFRVGPSGQSKLLKDPAHSLQMNVLQRKIAGRWGEPARREECSDMAAASDLSWGLSLTRTTPFPVMWHYLTIAWPFLVHQIFDMAHGRSYSGNRQQYLLLADLLEVVYTGYTCTLWEDDIA